MDNILNMQYYPTNSQVDAVPQSSPLRKRRCLNKEVIFLFFNWWFFFEIEIEIEYVVTTYNVVMIGDKWKFTKISRRENRKVTTSFLDLLL